MNAARQIITRRSAMAMGPRLTQTTRFASTHAHSSSQLSKKDRSMMHGIFTAATLATASGVAFAAARSGSRMSNRYATKNSKLDSSKWFAEGTEVETMLGRRH